ncbi:MAG: hypothetical protein ACYT04_58590 [Nostoc sp.]
MNKKLNRWLSAIALNHLSIHVVIECNIQIEGFTNPHYDAISDLFSGSPLTFYC